MSSDRRSWLRILGHYLSVRRTVWLLGLALGVAVTVALFGTLEVGAPSSSGDGTLVSFWRLFSVVSGTLPVLFLSSQLSELEEAAGAEFRRVEAIALGTAFLVSGVLLVGGCLFVADPTAAGKAARALLAWFGLGLVSGRVLGWRFCWVLPWVALSALLYWGFDSGAQAYAWWEFTAQPIAHTPSLLLSVGLCLGGGVAYHLTPWRLAAVRRSGRRFSSREGVEPARPCVPSTVDS
jgi:hypothetical protein